MIILTLLFGAAIHAAVPAVCTSPIDINFNQVGATENVVGTGRR
jgi:hypothetical protein